MSSANKNESIIDDDKRYFLNPESVSIHLFCSICQEVFDEPQRAPCGHSFCKKCILQWLKKSKTCPEDRRVVTTDMLHHDFILQNIIGDQLVACPFRRNGCTHVGALASASSHKRDCGFNPSNLPEFLRKTDELQTSFSAAADESVTAEDEVLPNPVQPSLKMRLFQAGGTKRELLCSAFENKPGTSQDPMNIKRLKKLLDD